MSVPPESASSQHRPAGRLPRLRHLMRRVARFALRDELQAIEERAAVERSRLERLGEDVATLANGGRQLQDAHEGLRRHLETRQDQTGAELEDLRGAFFAARDVLTELRDRTAPTLSARLDGLSDESARMSATLQREVEGLRDVGLPGVEHALRALQGELEAVRDGRLGRVEGDLGRLQADLGGLLVEIEGVRDVRLGRLDAVLEGMQATLRALQAEIEGVRDHRLPQVEKGSAKLQAGLDGVLLEVETVRDSLTHDLARAQLALQGVQGLAEELRDSRLPALNGRVSALVERLHEGLSTTAGLVDRLLLKEPLRVATSPEVEAALPEAIRSASRQFIDEFRGTPGEIGERLEEYLPLLRDVAPVLDLGCGRGELLQLLQREGVPAQGVDVDPAMTEACRRLGLDVREVEALDALRAAAAGSFGAIVAVQLLEHLQSAAWMELVDGAARALRKGGLLLVECPNPTSLRVGGSLFWLDPTHRAPVHPDALAFVARAVGLEVVEIRYLHAFPSEQALTRPGQSPEVRELAERLDGWLSAPRDFMLLARRR